MTLDAEVKLEGFFLPQSSAPGQCTNVLHVRWNASRRVHLRTSAGDLVYTEEEPLGSSASASFGFRLGSESDLFRHIWYSLESLNFTNPVIDVLCPKISAFALSMAAGLSGPPYPSIFIFAHLNLVDEVYVDHTHRQLPAFGLVDETVFLDAPTEEWVGVDDEEGAEEEDEGASDSAIDTLRRRKLERRGGEEESCSICLETFSDGEEVIPLRCVHIYHESCILTWLKRSQSCPLCRRREI